MRGFQISSFFGKNITGKHQAESYNVLLQETQEMINKVSMCTAYKRSRTLLDYVNKQDV